MFLPTTLRGLAGGAARAAWGGVKGAWGTGLGRSTMIGAGAGALWGAMSSDTSVLGGAMMGAGIGAGYQRYGRQFTGNYGTARAFGMGRKMAGGLGLSAMGGVMRADVHRFGSMMTRAYNRVGSTLKGWRS